MFIFILILPTSNGSAFCAITTKTALKVDVFASYPTNKLGMNMPGQTLLAPYRRMWQSHGQSRRSDPTVRLCIAVETTPRLSCWPRSRSRSRLQTPSQESQANQRGGRHQTVMGTNTSLSFSLSLELKPHTLTFWLAVSLITGGAC